MSRATRGSGTRVASGLLLLLVLVAGTGLEPATAYWNASSSGAGIGSAGASTLARGATPSATASPPDGIGITWARTGFPNGPVATGYTVARYDAAGTRVDAGGGCAGAQQAVSCSEAHLPDGVWTYTVTPRYGNWAGRESAQSAAVRTDTTAPVHALGLSAPSASFSDGATVWFRSAVAGSFRVSDALADAGSGPASITSGSVGSAAGWSHTPLTVSSPAGGPFVTNAYSWIAGATGEPAVTISGSDAYGNRADSSLVFTRDDTAPTGGAIGYADGVTNSKTLSVTVGAVSDTGSGAATGALQISTAPLGSDNATCGTFGAFTFLQQVSPGTTAVGLSAGTCSRFQYVVADRVGNVLTTTSASVVRVPGYRAAVMATPGLLRFYRLDETSGTPWFDSVSSTSLGAAMNSPKRGAAGALAGDPDSATAFDGSTQFGTIPREVADDFSIEFWFRSVGGLGADTTDQWYKHGPLLDADTSGGANDFGIGLTSTGRVVAGVGTPDKSVFSGPGFNDGSWHHVVMTRTATTGAVVLYVDGQQSGSVTGSTASLTSTPSIYFPRRATNTEKTACSLDEIALYSSVLTAAQVKNHHDVGAP